MSKSILAVGVLAVLDVAGADAQWTVTNLHLAGTGARSSASGATSALQVGSVTTEGVATRDHACLWSGSAGSWVDLEPEAAVASGASGISGTQIVGFVGFPFGFSGYRPRAVLWNGTPESMTDLHPVGAITSMLFGSSGTNQVGVAALNSVECASLWSGTAESWVNLHPGGASSSASAVWGDQQVGGRTIMQLSGFVTHAALWNGTAASHVNLHPFYGPIGPVGSSYATDTSGAQQVGYAGFDTKLRASLWRGTASSWTDLHPVGATESIANSIHGTQQVGYAQIDGVARASLWNGSAASWVDLGAFAPADFTDTYASSIWRDASSTYIAGSGFNVVTGRSEALLWVHNQRDCPADTNTDGTVNVDDLLAIIQAWGPCPTPPAACPADINQSGAINVDDLVAVLRAWGSC